MPEEAVDWGAFDVVTDEKRLAILRALADRQRERPREPELAFADLRERAGIRDSGNFNYHLRKLRDRFVRKTDEGYRLTPPGVRMVGTIVAESATPAEDDSTSTRVDGACPVCGTTLTATYESELVSVECEAGHRFPTEPVAPRLVADRDIERVVDLVGQQGSHHLEQLGEGVCFNCQGRVSLAPTEPDGVQTHFTGSCADCGITVGAPAVHYFTRHPATVSFLYQRGVDPRDREFWEYDVDPETATVESEDPYRLRITVREGGDALHLTVDDDLAVVDTRVETAAADGTDTPDETDATGGTDTPDEDPA